MPVIPNLRRSGDSSAPDPAITPLTYVDTPAMDYVKWLQGAGNAIATFSSDPSALSVAVVGSGGAGLTAAYELLRCGMNVTLYEATDRVGGRLFTSPSSTGDGNVFEMGAMRFTPSEHVLHYYSGIFTDSGASKIVYDNANMFPDPGVNNTYIAFQSQTYPFIPGGQNTLPPSYKVCGSAWDAFMNNGFRSADGSIELAAPNDITGWLSDPGPNQHAIVQAWSSYIGSFVNSTLYEAVVRIFTDDKAPGGVRWSQTDLEFFGALGTGFGGFGPLFPISFLDIMRFVINAVDSDQHELVTGVQSIVDGFMKQKITQPGGKVTSVSEHVRTGMPVSGIAMNSGKARLSFEDGSSATFDRVVVATSHRSMEITMGLGYSRHGLPLAEPVADSVRRLHLENSSKVFVETSAFWTGADPSTGSTWPRNVVGDTLLRNFYTLIYPQAAANTGALLFSYTWADDSVKQQTVLKPDDRVQLLLRDLATISPDFATVVRNSLVPGTAQVIDWQNEPYFYGAFKLNQPGQDAYVQSLFYDFQKAAQKSESGVFLAGDSIGFLGGWVENALQTGLNAAAGVAVSLGGTLQAQALSPFARLNPRTYDYVADGATAAVGAPPV